MSINARGESRLRKDKNVKSSALQKFSPDKPHMTNLTIRSQRKDQADKCHKSPDPGKKSPGGFNDTANTSFKKSPGKDDVKVLRRIFYLYFKLCYKHLSAYLVE